MRLYGIDTNLLLRVYDPRTSEQNEAALAIASLQLPDTKLFCTVQNIAEFWNVFTRPIERNGFGLSPQQSAISIRRIEGALSILRDSERSYRMLLDLLTRYAVRGVQVHDARIAATLLANGVTNLLTFNTADFRRYDGLTAIHPNDLLASA